MGLPNDSLTDNMIWGTELQELQSSHAQALAIWGCRCGSCWARSKSIFNKE
jgi:hypothetical protein